MHSVFKQVMAVAAFFSAGIGMAQAVPVSGNLEVYNLGTGTTLGYVRSTYDGQNSYTYGTLANALTVSLDPASSTPFAISIVGKAGPNNYFGSVGGSSGYNFNAGQLGYTYFSGSALTAPGAAPTFASHDIQALGYNAPVESSIFSLSGSDLVSQWVNTDSSVFAASFFYDPSVDFLGQVGDFSKFASTFPTEGAFLVGIRFTGNLTTPTNVPEPITLTLFGAGLVGAAALRRRKKA